MQGLPRINMISIDLRESNEAPDLSSLHNYIERHYNENSDNYKDAFKEFLNLRNMCLSGNESLTCLANMKRYYCQLQLLKARFPLTTSSNDNCTVAWSWEDSNSNTTISLTDIRFEEASVLYNIGCLHCNLGAKESRVDLDTTKVACTHFQCSAWAFQTILDKYTPLSVADLECDLLRFLNLLLLAEAHECVLEKSMVDQRRAGITAKIAFQISDFYKQCQGLLKSENIGYAVNSRHYMTWKRMCNLKEHMYFCLSYYYMGLVAEEAKKYGDIIAWLKLAKEKLDNCWKPLKKMKNPAAEETIKFVQDVVNGKLESSIKDNNFIYYEKIPEPEMLPPIKGAMLLKGIGFDVNDPDLCGKDIFRNLIPMETHISSSVYSEKKAEILRQIQLEIENKNELIEQFLINMGWDSESFILTDSSPPQELFNCAAFVSANTDVLETIKSTMQVISSISIEVEESLELLSDKIKSAEIDKSLSSWKSLEQDYVEFVNNFEDAKESNSQLRDAFACTLNDFSMMQKPMEEVLASFPSLKEIAENEESQKLIGETKRLLDKVEEMRTQRSELLHQLKAQMIDDDLTHLLLGCKLDAERNKIIEDGLKKHNDLIDYLRQNMSAQNNIMDAIVEHNAKIADTRLKISKVKQERENVVNRIVRSFNLFKSIIKKGEEGIEFYRKLSDRVMKQHKELEKLIQPKKPQFTMETPSIIGNPISQIDSASSLSQSSLSVKSVQNESINTNKSMYATPDLVESTIQFNMSRLSSNYRPPQSHQPQAPVMIVQGQGQREPRLKDYLMKERKEPSSLSTSSASPSSASMLPTNLNPSQFQYIPWGFYGPPSGQTTFTPNYSVSKSKIQDSEFRTTQNIYVPALASEIDSDHHSSSSATAPGTGGGLPLAAGPGAYPNYSSLPRTNSYSMLSSSSSVSSSFCAQSPLFMAPLSSSSSIGNLAYNNSTGFTIPYQRNSFENPNVISMAHGFGNVSAQGSKHQLISSIELEKQQVNHHHHHLPQYHQYCSYPYTHEMKNSKTFFSQPSPPSQLPINNKDISNFDTVAHHYQQQQSCFNGNDGTNSVQYNSMMMGHLINNIDSFTGKYQSEVLKNQYFDARNVDLHQINAPSQSAPAEQAASAIQNQYSTYYINNTLSNHYQQIIPSAQMVPFDSSQSQSQMILAPSSSSPSAAFFQTNQHQQQQQSIYLQNNQHHKPTESRQIFTHLSPSPHKQQPSQQLPQNQLLQPQPFNLYSSPNNSSGSTSTVPQQQSQSQSQSQLQSQSQPQLQPQKLKQQLSEITDQKSSNTTDDLLSSSPTNSVSKDSCSAVLEPKILTKEELKDQQEEKRKQIYHKQHSGSKHPLNDPLVLNRFIADAERFLKKINDLLDPTNTGAFEHHWNNLVDKEKNVPKKSTAIAKCSPMKNRFQDMVPYDDNRVIIKDGKDDYINASHILLQSIDEGFPRFIALQSPLSNTISEFWTAIFEQGCEILVQLATPSTGIGPNENTSKTRVVTYWPDNKSKPLSVGSKFEISVQSFKEKSNWNERILLIKHLKTNQSRSVWHFQVNNVTNKLPKSLDDFLAFEIELCRSYRQQRSLTKPIGVSCFNGSSVCGLFILLTTALLQMEVTGTFPDIDGILSVMWPQRKNIVEDKHQLAFVYRSVSKASSDMLSKRNIVIGPGRNSLSSSTITTVSSGVSAGNSSSSSSSSIPEHHQSLHGFVANSNSSTPGLGVVGNLGMTIPSTNSILDSIFSNHHLQISDLDSVLSKWSVSKIDEQHNKPTGTVEFDHLSNSSITDSYSPMVETGTVQEVEQVVERKRSDQHQLQNKDEKLSQKHQEHQQPQSMKKIFQDMTSQLTPKLVHLQDPYSIDFTPTPIDKRKMTKREFEAKLNSSSLSSSGSASAAAPNSSNGAFIDCFDPLKALDPIHQQSINN